MSPGKSIKKNAALNLIKQACTIVFPFITFSYASHVMGSEKMGFLSFGQSIISYLAYVAMLGVSEYSIREVAKCKDNREEVNKLSCDVFSINVYSTILAYVIMALLLVFWRRLDPYRTVIIILGFQMLLTTIGADWVNTAYEDFAYLTIRYILVEIICIVFMLLFVKGPEDLLIYAFIILFATAGGNLLNVIYIRKYVKLKFIFAPDFRKHLPHMLILFFNSVALVIYLNSDITILGILKNDVVVGVYAIATKIYLMVKALINSIIMVTVPRTSKLMSEGNVKEVNTMLSKVTNTIIALGVPMIVGVFMEASNIIYLVGGPEYVNGITSLKIYSVTIIFAVSSCFVSYAILLPNNLEKYFMYSTMIAAVVNIGLNFILIPVLSLNGAAITTLIAEACVLVMSFGYARKHTSIVISINWRDLIKCLGGGVGIGIICHACSYIKVNPILQLSTAVMVSAVFYCAFLLITRVDSLKNLMRNGKGN